jgi:hypothetical protein
MKDIQAFPNEGFNGWGKPEEGMTLRDYFAAKAMQGVLSRPTAGLLNAEDIAPAVYMMADAMLKARGQ